MALAVQCSSGRSTEQPVFPAYGEASDGPFTDHGSFPMFQVDTQLLPLEKNILDSLAAGGLSNLFPGHVGWDGFDELPPGMHPAQSMIFAGYLFIILHTHRSAGFPDTPPGISWLTHRSCPGSIRDSRKLGSAERSLKISQQRLLLMFYALNFSQNKTTSRNE